MINKPQGCNAQHGDKKTKTKQKNKQQKNSLELDCISLDIDSVIKLDQTTKSSLTSEMGRNYGLTYVAVASYCYQIKEAMQKIYERRI